jgi:hypothetical protein
MFLWLGPIMNFLHIFSRFFRSRASENFNFYYLLVAARLNVKHTRARNIDLFVREMSVVCSNLQVN